MNADQAIAIHKAGRVPEGVIFVELVCKRDLKDDCRGGTKTVWNGQGDIQPYPASSWQKLAVHPDVWALFDPTAEERAAQAEAEHARNAAADAQAQAEAEKQRAAAEAEGMKRLEDEAKGNGTQMVMATAVPTFEQLQAMGADEGQHAELRELAKAASLGLHPRQRIDTVVERLVEHYGLKPATADEAGTGDAANGDQAGGDAPKV